MMAPSPLRSAMDVGGAEDTSLALPSDNKLRSGHQRVLDQVHSIKRGKSKHGKSGSPTMSPTGLSLQTSTSEFGSFKFSPSKTNGTFSRNATLTSGYGRAINSQRSRSLHTKAMGGRTAGTSIRIQSSNNLKPSRSDPALTALYLPAPGTLTNAKGQTAQNQQIIQSRVNRQSVYSVTNGTQLTSSQSRMVQPPSVHSHTDGRMGTMKISKAGMQQSAVNSAVNMSDITVSEAVELLSHEEESYQQSGANFIQHYTYSDDFAKDEVYQLNGIPTLVTLLRSSNPDVSHAAVAALRNVVFKHQKNKLEVQHCSGIAKALQLLKETKSTETDKQISGLLWNLSSEESLKSELISTAMPALTEKVLVPFTAWSETDSYRHTHPDVFFNTTGCLRNLSHSKEKGRTAMRDCPGLVDSLISYMQSCIAEDNPDDKSVENCACILHNLTYQLESEMPRYYQDIYKPDFQKRGNSFGCFSPRSAQFSHKLIYDITRETPVERVSGGKLLCHRRSLETYLSLLNSSKTPGTLEACCGALQNLTASSGPGSSAMSRLLVQKLGVMDQFPSLVMSPNPNLQKAAVSLLANLSRDSSLHESMAKNILPQLNTLISEGPQAMSNSDDTIASICSVAHTLMLSDTGYSKFMINDQMVSSLVDLSENGKFPKAKKAASLLLYSLWNEKTFQAAAKKRGMSKAYFVNDVTTAVRKSVQGVN